MSQCDLGSFGCASHSGPLLRSVCHSRRYFVDEAKTSKSATTCSYARLDFFKSSPATQWPAAVRSFAPIVTLHSYPGSAIQPDSNRLRTRDLDIIAWSWSACVFATCQMLHPIEDALEPCPCRTAAKVRDKPNLQVDELFLSLFAQPLATLETDCSSHERCSARARLMASYSEVGTGPVYSRQDLTTFAGHPRSWPCAS